MDWLLGIGCWLILIDGGERGGGTGGRGGTATLARESFLGPSAGRIPIHAGGGKDSAEDGTEIGISVQAERHG